MFRCWVGFRARLLGVSSGKGPRSSMSSSLLKRTLLTGLNSLSESEASAAALRLRFDLEVEPQALARVPPLARGVVVLVRGVMGVEAAVILPADPDFASFFNLKICSETARGVGLSSAFAACLKSHVSFPIISVMMYRELTPCLRNFLVVDGSIRQLENAQEELVVVSDCTFRIESRIGKHTRRSLASDHCIGIFVGADKMFRASM